MINRVKRAATLAIMQTVGVTAVANMLDSACGYMTDQPILSAVIPRPTLERLNFQALDPRVMVTARKFGDLGVSVPDDLIDVRMIEAVPRELQAIELRALTDSPALPA